MKSTTLYDFTLTAGGSHRIEADANFYKILTATGDVSITRNGGSTVKPMRAGRGERNVDFLTLTIKDLSGAPNSGTILVGDSDFIDDTIVLSSAINTRPESASGTYKAITAVTANSADQIVAPGSNANGIIVQTAQIVLAGGATVACGAFLAKSGVAPTTVTDGDPVLMAGYFNGTSGGNTISRADLAQQVLVPAGFGLYFISDTAINLSAGAQLRTCKYKVL
jgi:hypothetical protein